MPRVKFHNSGRIGILQDIPAYDLPPEAWSDGLNVRMFDGAVWKSFGHTKVMDPPTVQPFALFPAFSASGAQLFAYTGTADVMAQTELHIQRYHVLLVVPTRARQLIFGMEGFLEIF